MSGHGTENGSPFDDAKTSTWGMSYEKVLAIINGSDYPAAVLAAFVAQESEIVAYLAVEADRKARVIPPGQDADA